MFYWSTSLVDRDLLILQLSVSYTDTTFGANPLEEWSAPRRDRYQTTHTTLTRDSLLCCRRDSNPKSKQAIGHRHTPYTACSLGSAIHNLPQLIPTTTLIALKSVVYIFLTFVDLVVLREVKVKYVLLKCVKVSLIVN